MSSKNCSSSCSLGGINPGRGKYAVLRLVRPSGNLQEMTSTPQTCTSRVCSLTSRASHLSFIFRSHGSYDLHSRSSPPDRHPGTLSPPNSRCIGIPCPRSSLARLPLRQGWMLLAQCAEPRSSHRSHRVRRLQVCWVGSYLLHFTHLLPLTVQQGYFDVAHGIDKPGNDNILHRVPLCICCQRVLPGESVRVASSNDLICSCQLRSLRSVVLPDLSSTATPVTVSHAQRKRRITFLFFEAVIQVVYMTILVRV